MAQKARNNIPRALKGHIGDSFSPVINYFTEFSDYKSQLDANSHFIDFYALKDEIDWNLSFTSIDFSPKHFHKLSFNMKADWMLEHDVEPTYAPVLSHFIVSDWLAEQLDAAGETIVDFFGFPVWCRHHQSNSRLDFVLAKIVRDSYGCIPRTATKIFSMKSCISVIRKKFAEHGINFDKKQPPQGSLQYFLAG